MRHAALSRLRHGRSGDKPSRDENQQYLPLLLLDGVHRIEDRAIHYGSVSNDEFPELLWTNATAFIVDTNTVPGKKKAMLLPVSSSSAAHGSSKQILSIQDLVERVNHWCDENSIAPVNGQTAERLTERNVRYYRARGLLDPPGLDGPGAIIRRGFTEKHAAQLKVIRLLQARGLPLSHIQQQIRGRSVDELNALTRRELRPAANRDLEIAPANGQSARPAEATSETGPRAAGQEHWLVSSLGDDFLLVSRRGQTISEEQRRLLVAVLRA